MISTENVYIIFSLNSHENGTENTLHHPHVRIMADKKRYLQTYFAVKDNYRVHTCQGKVREKIFFFKVRELSEFWKVSENF